MAEEEILVNHANPFCLSEEEKDSQLLIQFWVEGVVQANFSFKLIYDKLVENELVNVTNLFLTTR